jgi:4-amino-4-deoxy-L-arabinose transferase-like glycosyltransferase
MTAGVIEERKSRWETVALLGVLAAAALLYGWALGGRMLQPYYAAAVHSMAQSPAAFLFAGYDPAGVVSIDKPPLAFWVQVAGTWIFGYHWWAIALVQAAEGVAAVLVLHRTVRRWAGAHTALLAALLLALSPVTAAINRDDVPDTLLVLLLLLAAYCTTRAVEGGRTGWLAGAGALVGLAFLTKMLAAWVVLPALALAYLAAPVPRGRKLGQLTLAGVVTVAVSLSWPVVVTLWPGGPYVGSSSDGSIWQLIFGYNGFGRVLADDTGSLSMLGSGFGGQPGPLRLFDTTVGGQIGWLLPVAIGSVLIAAGVWLRTRGGTPEQRAGWLLWGGWLVGYGVVFSIAGGIFHPYYTATLAPAVAATAAAGLTACWRWYRAGDRAGLLLPAAIAVTSVLAFVILDRTPNWVPWLRFAILIVGVLSALLAAVPRFFPVALAGLLAMVAGPAAFAVDTAAAHPDVVAAGDPSAGPASSPVLSSMRTAFGGGETAELAYVRFMDDAPKLSQAQQQVLSYVMAQDPTAPITLAVEGGSYGADPFLINTDARVATLGGYLGLDPAPTAKQLTEWVQAGRVRFILLPAVFRQFGGSQAKAAPQAGQTEIGPRITWFTHHCAVVPPASIGSAAAAAGLLFDCR